MALRDTIWNTLFDTPEFGDTTPDTPSDTLAGHLVVRAWGKDTISGYPQRRQETLYLILLIVLLFYSLKDRCAPSQPMWSDYWTIIDQSIG